MAQKPVPNFTGYWTFFFSLEYWTEKKTLNNFYEFLDGVYEEEDWGIANNRKEEFTTGQLGIIKVVGNNKEPLNGIYAIVEVTTKFEKDDLFFVNIKVVHSLCKDDISPILKAEIENNALLSKDKYLIKAVPKICSLPLNEEAFKEICRITNYKNSL